MASTNYNRQFASKDESYNRARLVKHKLRERHAILESKRRGMIREAERAGSLG